jgi:hypothetical protein
MKTVAFFLVFRETLSEQGFRDLCALFPSGDKSVSFSCEVEVGSLGFDNITSHLKANGLEPSDASSPGRYRINYHRVYDDADLGSAEYLAMFPTVSVETRNAGTDETGLLIVDAAELPTQFLIGFSRPRGVLVVDSLKSEIETAGFAGPIFRETLWFDPLRAFRRERIWEINTDVILPKMANVHQIVHAQGEPFNGDYSRPIWVREPPFAPGGGELHYRTCDLQRIEPFDLARTFEFHRKRSHTLVASQRVYQFCSGRKLPIKWQPVRIDPG